MHLPATHYLNLRPAISNPPPDQNMLSMGPPGYESSPVNRGGRQVVIAAGFSFALENAGGKMRHRHRVALNKQRCLPGPQTIERHRHKRSDFRQNRLWAELFVRRCGGATR